MNGLREAGSGPDLRWYLGFLWRRKFVILPLVLVLPLSTQLLENPPPDAYEASATVLLNRQSQGASEIGDPSLWDPARNIRTQTELARLPEVARRVVDAAGLPGRDAGSFLANSSIGADVDNDFLIFRARDGAADVAVRLANLYATKYIEYRRELDTQSLREAADQLTEQIERLDGQGVRPEAQIYQSLLNRRQQLQTAETLQASKALLVRPASSAGLISTDTRRKILIALGLGLVLGLGLAYLIETLDTRVRSVDEILGRLGLPLLAALPPPARQTRRQGKLVMLDEPNSPPAEPYRMLRASLEVSRATDCRLLMVTSAVEAEGKSTTAANLAVAMARAGQHVVLVDLDLYRPGLDRWFRVPPTPGLTDMALANVPLEDALRSVSLGSSRRGLVAMVDRDSAVVSRNGRGRVGRLEVLTRGSAPENPGEFIAAHELEAALDELRERADIVIVDGPPLLLSGDGMVLSSKVDGMLVVARLNVLKQAQVDELWRVLSSCPAAKLGVVITGVPAQGGYYYYRYDRREIGEPQRQLAD